MNKNNKGFSLIELMVGITIVIIASTVVLSIIISSFRISSKTTSSSVIRQNGNYALSQVTRMLQFADKFESITCGTTTYQNCNDTDLNSCSAIQIYYGGSPTPTDITCSSVDPNDGLKIGTATSIDVGKIDITSCSFSCSQDPGEAPVIGVDLNLTTRGAVAVEKKSSINFSTSVKMRNSN